MSRPLRIQYPGALYHITSRGNGYNKIFIDDEDRKTFLKILASAVEKYDWVCHAYCLMDNHYHLLIKTGSDPKELSKFMQRFLTSFCLYTNKKYNLAGHVFQGRYQASLIETERYKRTIIRYFKKNPVKAKYARVWHQYRWLYLADDL